MHSNPKTYTIFSYKRIIGGVLPVVPVAYKIWITSQGVIVKAKISPLMYVANLPFLRQAMMGNTTTIINFLSFCVNQRHEPVKKQLRFRTRIVDFSNHFQGKKYNYDNIIST